MIQSKFDKLCEIVLEYGLANIFEVVDFIENQSNQFFFKVDEINTLSESQAELIGLYFDGAYQRSKRGEKKDE